MILGEVFGLRARLKSDVAVLHSELHNDVKTRAMADSRPWRPISPDSEASPYQVSDPSDQVALFSVFHLADDQLVGEALLWGIDTHNREAHLGLSLRPSFRGRGAGTEVVSLLCRYGFVLRGLHRLQLETLADNEPMLRSAARSGFVREGTRRRAAWVYGEFVDEAILGLLAEEWTEVNPG
jgi:RimJ/RimL family protein N-acetyltransferase